MTALLAENELVAQLLRSPRLPIVAGKLDALLADEAQRRAHFIDTVLESEKSEFINGEPIVHSPVKFQHNVVTKRLLVLLDAYVTKRGLGYVGYEKLMISLTRNDYEPDICYFSTAKAAAFQPEQMRFPAPDFIVEVLSASTEANDRGVKSDDYAAHGVAEYWLIDPDTQTVEQYRLHDDVYELAIKAQTGELHSIAVSGFEIPVRAIFEDEVNQATLRRLLVE